jgi:hypothetical protein
MFRVPLELNDDLRQRASRMKVSDIKSQRWWWWWLCHFDSFSFSA